MAYGAAYSSEIRTPGIGLPLLTAVVGALLYFAPAYMVNLLSNWELLLFITGLILLAMEIFVIPGFGVCGILGIIAVVLALAFGMVDNADFYELDGTFTLTPLLRPICIVTVSAAASIFGGVWLVRRLYATRSFDHIALREEMSAAEGYSGVVMGLEVLVGKEVTVLSDLKPSGKVRSLDGYIYEAILRTGGYASKGETLKVVAAEQGRLYCEKQ